MSMSLTIVERIVIESLDSCEKNLITLSNDTGLQNKILNNVLGLLIKKQIVIQDINKDLYKLNKDEMSNWVTKISQLDAVKNELRGVFDLVIGSYQKEKVENDNHLRMQKVYMTSSEEKIYNQHMVDLENFFREVRRNRLRDRIDIETKNKKVIYWGSVDYKKLINEALA